MVRFQPRRSWMGVDVPYTLHLVKSVVPTISVPQTFVFQKPVMKLSSCSRSSWSVTHSTESFIALKGASWLAICASGMMSPTLRSSQKYWSCPTS